MDTLSAPTSTQWSQPSLCGTWSVHVAVLSPDAIIARPPAPVMTMLGEIVVHGHDIRGAVGQSWAGLDDLTGDGLATLRSRMPAARSA